MSVIDDLHAFVSIERRRFNSHDGNVFGISFHDIVAYRQMLGEILRRYVTASENHRALMRAEFDRITTVEQGSHPATDEEMRMIEATARLCLHLRLEIESFYLFAKILLDNVAHTFEYYFGQAHGVSLDSHDQLVKGLEYMCSQKELVGCTELLREAEPLKTRVADFRDYQIQHEKSPRTIRPVMFSLGSGHARIALTQVMPTKERQQVESEDLTELIQVIDSYIGAVIRFLERNSTRTRLTLETGR